MINFPITDCSVDSFGVKYIFDGFSGIYIQYAFMKTARSQGREKGARIFRELRTSSHSLRWRKGGPAGARYLSHIAYQCEPSRNTRSR